MYFCPYSLALISAKHQSSLQKRLLRDVSLPKLGLSRADILGRFWPQQGSRNIEALSTGMSGSSSAASLIAMQASILHHKGGLELALMQLS